MRCRHAGCSCDVSDIEGVCSDHCRKHAEQGGHLDHVCECEHAACGPLGQ